MGDEQGPKPPGSRAARLWLAAATIWLAAATGWYVWTAANANRHLLNAGPDRQWALLWLLYAAIAPLWHMLVRRPLASVIWLGALAAIALVMIAASGGLLAALGCLWLVVLAGSLGDRLLRLLRAAPSEAPLEWACVAIAVGLVLLALAALALGVLQALTPAAVLLLCAALTVLEAGRLLRAARAIPGRQTFAGFTLERSLLAAVCGFVALENLAGALAPEIHYDALNYHLAVPRAFLEHGGVLDLPFYWHSYFAQMMESLFAICLALGGSITAKLLSFSLGALTALAVWALARVLFDDRIAWRAAALFYATPMAAWLSTTTYTDLAAAFFPLASLIAFLRWREDRQGGWLCASAFLAGAAAAVKITAAYGLPVLGIVMLIDLFCLRGTPGRPRWRLLLIAAAAFLLAAAPWYALRYALTGNPFFPVLNQVFPGARAIAPDFDVASIVGEGYGKTRSAVELLTAPFSLTFATNRFGEPFPTGALGASLAILFPLGLALLARKRAAVWITGGVFALAFLFWNVFRGVRHVFVVLPLAAALAAGAVDALSPSGGRRRLHGALLAAILLAQVPVIPPQFWNSPERIPLARAFGRESPDAYLTRVLPSYSAVRYINRVAKPGEDVLGYAAANVRFYLNPRLRTRGEDWEVQRLTAMRGSALASGLSSIGCVYLLLPEEEIKEEADPRYPFVAVSFLDRFAALEFREHGWRVYRLSNMEKGKGG